MVDTRTPGAGQEEEEEEDPYPMEVTMPDGVTKITLTRDMAIRALKHMDDYTLPPEDASREDMLAYRYLMWKDTQKIRLETERLARRKEAADESSARRAALSFTSSSNQTSVVHEGGGRHRSRLHRMTDQDRIAATRNLETSYLTEDAEGIPIPKTASAALMSIGTYLQLTQPPEGDPRANVHKQQIKAHKLAEDARCKKIGRASCRERV